MVVCRFFLRGNCDPADSNRNEHPGIKQGDFGNDGRVNRASGSPPSTTTPNGTLPYNAANIVRDLTPTEEKPLWPLSAYGPARYEPNLIGGLDESTEELRVKAMRAIRAGNVNEYLRYETAKIAAADSVFAGTRANSTQAFEQAAKQSNFLSPVGASSSSKSSKGGGSAFGNTTTTPSAFGNTPTPSAFGNLGGTAATSAFGQPSFGQPSTPNALASASHAFAQSSLPSTKGAFSQTSNPTISAFGQPRNTTASVSALGLPQHPTSVFGQPAQVPATSAFGQPLFGRATQSPTFFSLMKPTSGTFSSFADNGPTNPFGGAANTPESTTGGVFSALGRQTLAFRHGTTTGENARQQMGTSVFGQSVFGRPAQAAANSSCQHCPHRCCPNCCQHNYTTSAFGNLSQNNTSATSEFGIPLFGQRTTAPVAVFGGSPAATTWPAFGPMGFGNARTASAFGADTQAPPTVNEYPQ